MALKWFKCKGQVWCDLFKLDLSHEFIKKSEGVYVIWIGELPRKVLRVGGGKIARELGKLRNEITIKAFASHGVKVTWADVSALQRYGVLVYLNEELVPSMQKEFPSGIPIKVNLPWDEPNEDED